MQKVRLADIAQKVGVSTVTVHNALSGQKGVSEQLRARIWEQAEKMGYQPRTSAKKQSGQAQLAKIVVLVREQYAAQYTTFYWKMYEQMAAAAAGRACFTVIETVRREHEAAALLPEAVSDPSVAGIIVMGPFARGYLRSLRRQTDLPLVFLDYYDNDVARDAVVADNFHGAYLMTDHLLSQGVSRLAYVGSIHASGSIMDRYCGFRKALFEYRRDLPPEWLIEDRDSAGNIGFSLPEHLPQAFVCSSDLTAGMVMTRLGERGCRVPEDILVVGFENYCCPGSADLDITTYDVDTEAMAQLALERMLAKIADPRNGCALRTVNGHMICRRSSVRDRQAEN